MWGGGGAVSGWRCVWGGAVCGEPSVHLQVVWGGCVVALEEGLHEEAHGARHAHQHEDPQEEAVHHHGHVLPVLDDLEQEESNVSVDSFID